MKSVTYAAVFAALFASTNLVNAHGSVLSYASNGKSYTGPLPGSGSEEDSPVRQISTLSPVTDPSSPDMGCGPGAASSAKVVAQVAAGSNVTFGWRSGEASTPFPHRWGPTNLYAYQCPGKASDCSPPTGAEWALISAQGFDSDPSAVPASSGWVMDRFHNRMTVDATVPSNMPNGDYLFRHELIALHNGMSVGGAEYYASCTQVTVTGGATGSLKDAGAELVAIPGVYSKTDPGLKVDVFSGLTAATYVMPGPKVFGSTEGGAINIPKPPTNSSSDAPASSTDAPTTSTDAPSTSTKAPTSTESGSTPPSTPSTSCKRSAKSKRAMRKRKVARASLPERVRGAGKQRIVDRDY